MSHLIGPIADRPKFRRLAAAIDRLLGWPRQHTEADVIRHGKGPHAPIASIRTEAQTAIKIHAGRGLVSMQIDPVIMALRGREVDVTDGIVRRIRVRIDDAGWQVRAKLPWPEEGWAAVAPRDGLEGSTTGEPLP